MSFIDLGVKREFDILSVNSLILDRETTTMNILANEKRQYQDIPSLSVKTEDLYGDEQSIVLYTDQLILIYESLRKKINTRKLISQTNLVEDKVIITNYEYKESGLTLYGASRSKVFLNELDLQGDMKYQYITTYYIFEFTKDSVKSILEELRKLYNTVYNS